MPNRVTMADVAREAGVSLMTVSRVLNNKDDVAQETRDSVLAVIQRLGYRPSGIARSLVTKQTGTIGLVVPDISNPYFSGIAHGVSELAYSEGLSVLLCNTEEEPTRELKFLSVLFEKQVDGLILAAPRITTEKLAPLLSFHRRVVMINRLFEPESQYSASGYVVNDDMLGGRISIEHLLSRGHRTIGFLAGPVHSYGSQRRLVGYRAALAASSIPYRDEYVVHGPPSAKGGCEAAELLLARCPEITALFCFNDMVAIGALQACRLLGRRVPNDLAIIGYDDTEMASWVTPSLTTCRAPFQEMGRLATRLLINCLRESQERCEKLVLEPELIIRASAP